MRTGLIAWMIVLFVFILPKHGQALPSVSAEHAILMEHSSGRVLFEKGAHERKPIASITKIMTAIIAIEQGDLNEKATASRRAIYTEGSSIYLEQGEKMSLEDLLYGLMLRSGNDAAVTIAEHIGGSVEGFVYLMNEKAKWLGMTNTSFANPHGLEEENHYSTAYDMALLMRYAMTNNTFQKISETKEYIAKTRSYAWRNKNRLLTHLYPYCTGGKTGYTKRAGRTLVTSAYQHHMDLIAVTLNAVNDWQDHTNLYEWAFDKFQLISLNKKEKVTYDVKGIDQTITGYFLEHNFYPLSEQEMEELHSETFILKERTPSSEKIGKKVFYIDDGPLIEIPIYYPQDKRSSLLGNISAVFRKIAGFS